LNGEHRLIVSLLYGAGLRIMEAVRLRVKDLDFARSEITVRDGKGGNDRLTMLPESLKDALTAQVQAVHRLHEEDLKRGRGEVYLPYSLEKKHKNAATELTWQYLFPASKLSLDPRSGKERRHHVAEPNVQHIRTVQELPGHKDVRTTMIYTHVLNRGGRGVRSPLDR